MRIGVIADTHGYLDPRVREVFRGVDLILHGGDIGSLEVVEGLKSIAPVHAVSGNHEPEEVVRVFPNRQDQVTLEGKRIVLSHGFITFDWEYFEKLAPQFMTLLGRLNADALVYGHSHFPRNTVVQGILFFCPGYAGEDVRNPGRGVGILTIDKGTMSGEIVRL